MIQITMLEIPYLVNKTVIGDIEFKAYILTDEDNDLAFAISFQDYQEPLLYFHKTGIENLANLKINTSVFYHIQNLKSLDEHQRQQHYKEFEKFVLLSEYKGRKIAYGNKKFKFIVDQDLKECIRQAYLFN